MGQRQVVSNKVSNPEKVTIDATVSTSPKIERRVNGLSIQNYLLIWLDKNIDNNDDYYRHTITQLRCVFDTINTFTDADQCIQFIEKMDNDKAFMVISGPFGQHIVLRVHNMSQVDSIFIFCINRRLHEQWAVEWPKIKGVYTAIRPICEALRTVAQQYQKAAVPLRFQINNSSESNKSLNQLDWSYVCTKILKEILLSDVFEEDDIKEAMNHCRSLYAENEHELENIDELEKHYHEHTAIWWYTHGSFIYKMVHRALRDMDVNIIIRMRFYIRDLHRQIEQLYKEQFSGAHSSKPFIVYRGQRLQKIDFEKMSQAKGDLMSFNMFLSFSKDRLVSLHFAHEAAKNSDAVGIFLVMTVDPSISTVPFAEINKVSYLYSTESEVLFSTHTVFRIENITKMDDNQHVFQVDLTLTNEDTATHAHINRLRDEADQHARGWRQLGFVLTKMGQFDKAEEVYDVILKRIPDEREKGRIYHHLGLAKAGKDSYEEALGYYEKARLIWTKTLLAKHPLLASLYSDMGSVCEKLGEYRKALAFYEDALKIYQKIRPADHLDLQTCQKHVAELKQKL